jgi:hypothetical protein
MWFGLSPKQVAATTPHRKTLPKLGGVINTGGFKLKHHYLGAGEPLGFNYCDAPPPTIFISPVRNALALLMHLPQ